MTIKRTFGWIQNPSNLKTLRKVVVSLCNGSEEQESLINYKLPLLLKNKLISQENYDNFKRCLKSEDYSFSVLKGKNSGSSRKDAICTGIVQAIIDAQKFVQVKDLDEKIVRIKKPYSDDWSSEGYIRWAIALGLIEYAEDKDTCSVSLTGRQLSNTKVDSQEEQEIIKKSILAYPPAMRILQLLSVDPNVALSKFELGSKLGFKDEQGFTSVPLEYFVASLCSSENKSKVKSDLEGDSDKYARTIASWLQQLGWVEKVKKTVKSISCYGIEYKNISIGSGYKITLEGLKSYKKANGYSKHPRMPRRVSFQMLASKAESAEYLRKRRAGIIQSLSKSPKKICSIQKFLISMNVNATEEIIVDDIKGLNNIGLSIIKKDDKYKLEDTVYGLIIPKENIEADEIIKLKDELSQNLKYIDHKYLILVDYAFSDKNGSLKGADARSFEIETANLFTKELNFKGRRLGDSNRPDVIISYEQDGAIIDNKSYKNGFSIDKHCADEMQRYIVQNLKRTPGIPANEWWKEFEKDVKNFYFLFISSKIIGNFKNNLNELSSNTGIKGAAISVDNLLYLSDKLKGNELKYSEFFDLINNDEIISTSR